MKEKILLISLCFSIFANLLAQSFEVTTRATAERVLHAYRVYLSDKNNSPYSTLHPEAFLSQRCIEKRARYNVPITTEDLPVNPAYVQAIQQISSDLHVWTKSRWTNTLTLFCYDTTHLNEVRALACVNRILPIGEYYFEDKRREEHPSNEWRDTVTEPDTSIYGPAYRQIAMHNGHLLHSEGFTGDGMLIAVLDGGWSGFDYLPIMEELVGSGRLVGTYNVLPHENGLYNLTDHGTCCTSTIACNEAYNMVGTAPNAAFAFIRTEDVPVECLFEEDFWVRGAEIADSLGADVITSSLGYHQFDDTLKYPTDYSTCDGSWSIASQAATMAAHRAMIVCVAAGNEGMNAWHKLSRPSDAEDILCVGAVNVDSLYAPFSGCGPSYDGRVKPDVVACGWGTYVMRGDGTVMAGNGTSFATPIIAGLSACLWQAIPQLSSLEIMQIIRESGHQYSTPDTLMGYGIPNFYQAWLSHHTDDVSAYTQPSHYTIYPNPCRGSFNLLCPNDDTLRIALYDSEGRLILHERTTSGSIHPIQLGSGARGTYFLRITDGKGHTEIKKILTL